MSLGFGLIETVIFGAKTMSVLNKLGMDVIVGAITKTTTSIGFMIGHIMAIDQPGVIEIQKTLKEIDLEFSIEVLEELVNEHKDSYAPNSVKKSLDGVNQILINIENELKTIKEAIEYHEQKYFSSWRTFDCSCNVSTIRKNKELLDKRYKVLTDLLKIYSYQMNANKNMIKQDNDIKSEQNSILETELV